MTSRDETGSEDPSTGPAEVGDFVKVSVRPAEQSSTSADTEEEGMFLPTTERESGLHQARYSSVVADEAAARSRIREWLRR